MYLCSDKGNDNEKDTAMFGVKCSNQPITGKFAEEFVRHLLEAKQEPQEEINDSSFEIVCS